MQTIGKTRTTQQKKFVHRILIHLYNNSIIKYSHWYNKNLRLSTYHILLNLLHATWKLIFANYQSFWALTWILAVVSIYYIILNIVTIGFAA